MNLYWTLLAVSTLEFCICTEQESEKSDYSVRLVDGLDKNSGRLEMLIGDQWGTICDKHFTEIDAEAVCHGLQLSKSTTNSSFAKRGTFQGGTGIIWNITLNCDDEESSLSDCVEKKVTTGCSHAMDVGVICMEKEGSNVGLIVGCVIGGIVLVILVILCCLLKDKRKAIGCCIEGCCEGLSEL